MIALRSHARTIRTAGRLGWAIESNWADPWLFAIYSIIRPVSSALILVFMYYVITLGNTQTDLFAFMYVGNAFYMYVMGVLFGLTWVIIDDREHYQMIRYIYTAPLSIYTYLVGRGLAKVVITTASVIITLLFGIFLLGIPITTATIDWPLLAGSLTLGMLGITFFGILLCGIMLNLHRHSYLFSEGVAGMFYFLSAVIFPVEVLPSWLHLVCIVNPFTYWLELSRRATLGSSASEMFTHVSNGEMMLILAATTLALAVLSVIGYGYFEGRARRKGRIDEISHY
jgi:ABC-2 type transport system permease protein